MNEIKIDEKSRGIISQIANDITILESQMRLICQTIINTNGVEGVYHLSKDFKTLIKAEDDSK